MTTTDPTPAALLEVPDASRIMALVDTYGQAMLTHGRILGAAAGDAGITFDRLCEARDAVVSAITALGTRQSAAERVVAAAEDWDETGRSGTGPEYEAAWIELEAAVAALRATRDGGSG